MCDVFELFFAGWRSAKESATRFRANLSTVSWVVISRVVTVGALGISELGVEVEGCPSPCGGNVDKGSQ